MSSDLSVHEKHKEFKLSNYFNNKRVKFADVRSNTVDLLNCVWCKTIRTIVFLSFWYSLTTFSHFVFSQPHHPLIHSWINPPLHHPLILRPSTCVAHEKWEGDGREDEWNREWGMKGREKEKSKIGKNALWLDLKVCGISFSERGELHLLQIL